MTSNKLDGPLAARVHTLAELTAAADIGQDTEQSAQSARERVRVLVHVTGDLAAVERAGLWTETRSGPIAIGTVAIADLEQVAALDDVVAIQSDHRTRLHLDDSGPEIRAQLARAVPPGFSGRDVVVGVVDSGIDIFHHAFRKADGTTRIVSLLDLTLRDTITVTGGPTGGSIRLDWQPPRPATPPGGNPPALPPAENTPALPFPLTAAALRTALEAFATINPGDVVVTGGPLPATPLVIDFAGRYDSRTFDSAKLNKFSVSGTLVGGTAPGMTVVRGREFLPAEINTALQTPNQKFASRDENGHGTHVAGIAAGDGSQKGNCHGANHYIGIAPEADLAIVRTTLQTTDNIRGAQHIFDQNWRASGTTPKPAVVNLSIGGQMGARDGSEASEIAFDGMLTGSTGRMIVIAAGNDGNIYDHASPATQATSGGGLHARKVVPANGTATLSVVIQAKDRVTDLLDLWYSGPGRISFNIATPNPGGASLPAAIAAGAGSSTPTLATHPLFINSRTSVAPGLRHNIHLQLSPPAGGQIRPGTWTITLRETQGTATTVDCWIGLEETEPHARFVNADQDRTRTLTTPGSAILPITIGAYNPDDDDLSALAAFSGRGPTTDSRPKPELCAPGVGITAALTGARHTGSCCESCTDFYVDKDGTSMATPHVAGVVALMFQANPALDHATVKTKLVDTCRPPEPGAGQQPPESGWGRGRVDAEAAVKSAKPTTTVAGADEEPVVLSAAAYPANYLPTRTRMLRLQRRVGDSPAGQLAAALISEHVDEVVRLVNTERRVIVAWHRMNGPVLLRLLLSDVDRDVLVPRTLGGTPVVDGLARLLDELSRAGSPALRTAITKYRTFALALPGARLTDLDNVLRVS